MSSETLRYRVDGLDMVGDLFRAESIGEERPVVLVFPDAFGLGEHARHQARRFADAGYTAFACDLHGNAERLESLPGVLQFVSICRADPSSLRSRAAAALEMLMEVTGREARRVIAVGYCLGGTTALELARSGAPIAAAVGLHGGLATAHPGDAARISGKVLACIGAADPIVSPEERAAFEAEMRAANVDWQLHVYGGVVHSFTDPSVDRLGQPHVTRFDAAADRRSWASILDLLEEVASSDR